jgi:PAS domain S-box-containing protein
MAAEGWATILLLEDEAGVARLEQLRLERAGYTVVAVSSAEAALEHVTRGGIDLIILDQGLQAGASGLEFLRQIKSKGHSIPAILVTGLQQEGLLVEALRAGVRDFVPKTVQFLDHLEPVATRVLQQVRTEQELAESRILARQHEARRWELEHEVAQRKRVEQALREAEEKLRLMVESATDSAIFTVDPEGRIASWNSGAARLFGYSEPEILGHDLATLFTEEDSARRVPEQELATAASKGRSSDERWHRRKDGSRFFASGVLTPIFDDENRLRGYTKVARDITDRKAGEEAIREAAVRLKAIVDTAADGIITIDEAGKVESMNPAAERIFGYPHAEVVGRHVWALFAGPHPADPHNGQPNDLWAGAQELLGAPREVEGRRKDGAKFPMELAVSETRLGLRRIFTGIVRDMTERKKTIEERTRLVIELEAERAALKDADERKDQFLAMLAHELRNPLAPISNAVQIMRVEGPGGPSLGWSIEVIEDQVKHLTRMVDDLLDVSRITRGTVELRKEVVELSEVVELAIEASRPMLEGYKHHLSVTLPEAPLLLEVDPPRMAQVLSNLLNNAAKYTPEGGQIAVVAGQSDRTVTIHVSDNGIGIAPDLLPRIFDLFVQADQTLSRSRGGVGIGLTLVKSLVELHGGRVTVTSGVPGKGSEFTIELPAAPDAPSPSAGADEHDDHDFDLPRRRILVVDDNRRNATSLEILLRALGQEVHTAHDGRTAVELARKLQPELVLLDIGLPVMDGYEVARRCRSEPGLKRTTLVAITGYGKEEDKRRSQTAGFDAHLVKPVHLEDLRHLLHEHSTSDRQ